MRQYHEVQLTIDKHLIFSFLFRFFIALKSSGTIIQDTETVDSRGSEILVNTELIESEARASRSLLLDLFVLCVSKERGKKHSLYENPVYL